MSEPADRMEIGAISPFFVVTSVARSVAYYSRLGFQLRFSEPEKDPFFAIVGRDAAQILLKHVEGAAPAPNPRRHAWIAWDAFVFVAEPDRLAEALIADGVELRCPPGDRADGLRGFETEDPDGYVLFFGRPR